MEGELDTELTYIPRIHVYMNKKPSLLDKMIRSHGAYVSETYIIKDI